MKHILFFCSLIIALFNGSILLAQSTGTILGVVSDGANKPIENVTIAIMGSTQSPVFTDKKGAYEYVVPAGKEITIVYHSLSYKTTQQILTIKPNERKVLSPKLIFNNQLKTVEITDGNRYKSLTRIDPIAVTKIPTASQDFNAILFTLPGVSSSNELSSSYSVRGGNFDENLVYVNGVEVYRPFLIRSGQQEGLSFVNPDMVSSILFSAGGYEAKYGDKMSSVLDVKYRRPREFSGTVSGSFLGSNLHLEGASKNYRFTWLLGSRYKTNQYLLNGLNTKGDYKPFYGDVQTCLTYNVTNLWDLQFLGNLSHNKYQAIPENRETDFGTVNEALKLNIYFDGQEIDKFTTTLGALTAKYHNTSDKLQMQYTGSVFNTQESESFDIQGQYYLSEIESDFTSDNFGDSAKNIGVGTYLNHARTELEANVYSVYHKGEYSFSRKKKVLWGVRYNQENISDNLSEWTYIDSAGYSIPVTDPQEIALQNIVKQKIDISSNRVSGYLQGEVKKETKDTASFIFNAGIRANYWSLNKQALVGPRGSIGFKPNWKRDFLFKFATGYYYQPPFYRELRDKQGVLNQDLKAQTAIHFVVTSDYVFKMWKRPFKFIVEGYYKKLDNLIPYEVDNVRIRYSAKNNAEGYATGIDMKLNGEFIKDLESWASISVMQTREDIKDDFYYDYYNSDGVIIEPGFTTNNVAVDSVKNEPDYIPRPTDQRVNFGLFFQDEMPAIPDLKMHLNLLFGTGLPFGAPNSNRYQQTLRMPAYRRVDLGFSYQVLRANRERKETSVGRHLKSVWVSVEVFNLLGTNNTVSYIWVEDVTQRQYAVPNFLTSRQLNVRAIIKF